MAVKNACGVLAAGLLPLGCFELEFQRTILKQKVAVYRCNMYPLQGSGGCTTFHLLFIYSTFTKQRGRMGSGNFLSMPLIKWQNILP